MSAYTKSVLKAAVLKMRTLVWLLSSEPLATLAGVYQDVRGQKPEELWREAVSMWAGWLLEVVPDLLGNAQLRPLAQASIGAFSVVLEAVQHQKHMNFQSATERIYARRFSEYLYMKHVY